MPNTPPPSKPTAPGPLKGPGSPLALKLAPAPKDKKEAAREAFLDVILNARSIASELIADFRASDRFFKYKAGVLAGWVALCGLTFFVSCPAGVQAPDNSLEARVRVNQVAGLERPITALFIENGSEDDWKDVFLELNNTFTAAVPSIRAGRSAVVQLDKFAAGDGRSPPPGLRPQRLSIRCSEGETVVEGLSH